MMDARTVAALLARQIREIADELLGPPTFRGTREWRWRRKGSLAVVVAGPKQGSWFDHEADMGGDALSLVAHVQRVPMRDAYHWAQVRLPGSVAPECRKEHRRDASKPSDKACRRLASRLWSEALPASGTPVERYLASRGLILPEDAPIRFHPACPRGVERLPAMIALMTAPETSEACGVHRTFLRSDGSGKAAGQAKMMLGGAGIIRLVPDADGAGLGLAEGIEDALALLGQGWLPVWAAGSAGAIRAFPILSGIEALTIFADADTAGLAAARDCACRWAKEGREARVIPPRQAGLDWNDIIRRVV